MAKSAWSPRASFGSSIYVMVYVERGEAIRVISLRQATKKEIVSYVENL
ncbi:BrnT family toxin [Mesorhizobium captivum]|nr:BrnT family toxin [Mesorhizobium sp. VK3C]MDX8449129.1 BrnT family toxin [Mesorhizobium sp. VK3C]